FRPAPGIEGWQISNPPVLAAAPLIASLALFQEAGIERLRAKSIALTGYLEFLVTRYDRGVERITPAAPHARGCQLPAAVAGGRAVFERLHALGVVCDWRDPDVIRVAPVPLYNSFEDVFHFAERLGKALSGTR